MGKWCLGTQATAFLFDGTATAIEAIEEIMGPPWVNPSVVLYEEPVYAPIGSRGNYAHSHIMISGADPDHTPTLYHELAHHYIRGPNWLREGGAEFLAYYTFHSSGGQDLQSRYAELPGVLSRWKCPPNIHERNLITRNWTWAQWSSNRSCDYHLGERFLAALYLELGHEMAAGSLRELDRMWRDYEPMTEEAIYQVLLSHTPPGREGQFQELSQRFHGRPAGYEPPPTATPRSVETDRAALAALYNATGGPNWANSANWLSGAPLADWHGVTTDAEGRVTALSIPGNNPSGEIPRCWATWRAWDTWISAITS